MGLETGSYISDLVATNPVAGDPKSEGDDHIRLIKALLKATFPNLSGAVNAGHADLAAMGSGLASVVAGTNLLVDSAIGFLRKDTSGIVTGCVELDATGSGATTLATLPAGYRPTQTCYALGFWYDASAGAGLQYNAIWHRITTAGACDQAINLRDGASVAPGNTDVIQLIFSFPTR